MLEITAGQGSNVGYSFEHLARIIESVHDKTRVGVCIDTAHAFSAGYDLKSESGYEKVFQQFDEIVGFEFLKGMHLNDSKKEFASKVDRHDSLGKGTLGLDVFRRIMNDSRFADIPLILETPNVDLWPQEIELLKNMQQ